MFTVSLSGPISQRPVTVEFATAPGTAVAGTSCPLRGGTTDYLTKTGTLTFSPPGDLLLSAQIARTKQISVAVCADNSRSIEPAETFFVNLARPVGATLAPTAVFNSATTSKLSVIRGTATIN